MSCDQGTYRNTFKVFVQFMSLNDERCIDLQTPHHNLIIQYTQLCLRPSYLPTWVFTSSKDETSLTEPLIPRLMVTVPLLGWDQTVCSALTREVIVQWRLTGDTVLKNVTLAMCAIHVFTTYIHTPSGENVWASIQRWSASWGPGYLTQEKAPSPAPLPGTRHGCLFLCLELS